MAAVLCRGGGGLSVVVRAACDWVMGIALLNPSYGWGRAHKQQTPPKRGLVFSGGCHIGRAGHGGSGSRYSCRGGGAVYASAGVYAAWPCSRPGPGGSKPGGVGSRPPEADGRPVVAHGGAPAPGGSGWQ